MNFDSLDKHCIAKEINSVSDVINILKPLEKYFKARIDEMSNAENKHKTLGKFPFGLWFRGQSNSTWQLIPKVFRESVDHSIYDETNIFLHFKFRSPQYAMTHKGNFDWLSLMQHYGTPTRLLDWSESILVALYFAAQQDEDSGRKQEDGKIYILDARRLNEHITLNKRGEIKTNNSLDVVVRGIMAECRSFKEFNRELLKIPSINIEWAEHNNDLCYTLDQIVDDVPRVANEFRKPVAVYPYRLNDRLNVQGGVFTIHGGKKYGYHEDDKIGAPINIEDLDGKCYYTYCIVKASEKGKIINELFALGIHKGSLFPELDYQSEYLTSQWLLPKR